MQQVTEVGQHLASVEALWPDGFKDGARWAAEEAAPQQLLQLEALMQSRPDFFRANDSGLPLTPCDRFHVLVDPDSVDGDAEAFWGGEEHDRFYIEDFAKGAIWFFDRNRRRFFS